MSKLDSYRDLIQQMIKDYPQIKSPVVLQHIQAKEFAGKITIIQNYLRELRQNKKQAFILFESSPAEE